MVTMCAGGAYTVGVSGAGSVGVTTNVFGSTATLTGGLGSGNNSFSNQVNDASVPLTAMAVGFYHIALTAG